MFGYSPQLYLEAASSNWIGLFGKVHWQWKMYKVKWNMLLKTDIFGFIIREGYTH